MDARALLTDAVLLTRGMASLDATMWHAALDPATRAEAGQALRQVAEDCQATTELGVRADAQELLRRLAEPVTAEAWQRLDATTAVPPRPSTPVTAYASSTARTAFVGIPNQSVVGPRSRSKSSEDSGPSARIRSSTRSATSAFSSRTCGAPRLNLARNHRNSLEGTSESPLL